MSKQLICSQCGHIGKTSRSIKGSGLLEIVLWLFFIIPGFIYSVWRSTSRYKTCAKCGSSNLIPIDSPMGLRMITDQGKTLEQVKEELKHEKKLLSPSRVVIIVLLIILVISIISASNKY